MKKYLIFGLAVLLGVQCFGACGRQRPDKPGRIQVGVACYDQSDTFLGELIGCLRKELAAQESDGLEITVTVRDAAGSQRTQDDQVMELIEMGAVPFPG